MPPEKRSARRGNLHKLVVQNFKSYAGKLTIGPFKDFTCVIGPNGSGKSNLMDAVSFVVGVNTAALRGTKLADFRSNLESATDEPTSVTLHYHAPQKDGSVEEILFTRTITVRDTSEYRVDGKKMDEKEYQKKLMSVGLLVKSRNFLVFQNEVEAVAQKSPKQLTELLERISGSEDLKKEYEELTEQKDTCSQASIAVYKRSVLVANEKKQINEQVKEAKTYQDLQKQEADMRTKRYLFELYHVEKQLEACADEADGHAGKLIEAEKDCRAVAKLVDKQNKAKGEKQKEFNAAQARVDDLEKSIKKIQQKDLYRFESEINMRKADLETLTKEVATVEQRIQTSKKQCADNQKHLNEVLETLKEEEKKGKSKDITLKGDQTSRYQQLREVVKAKSHKLETSVNAARLVHQNVMRDLQRESSELERVANRLTAAEEKHQQHKADKDQHSKTFQTLGEEKHKLGSEITDLDKKLHEDEALLKVLMDKRSELVAQIGDAKANEKNYSREKAFREKLEYLCNSFPGVKGRVVDLCKVRQRQYELAMTVVMESNMDAVVVEREETVKRCVEYLRDNKYPPMTFLPLDTISAMPPDERLRMIPGGKLALDLIDYDKAVEKAMWYVTGNAVVVGTLDEAKKLAFSQQKTHVRCKLVTMDACIISKSGAITGGDTTQLANKAQRWQQTDTKGTEKLKEKAAALETDIVNLEQNIKSAKASLRSFSEKKIGVDTNLATTKRLRDASEAGFKVSSQEVQTYSKQIEAMKPKVEKLKAQVEAKAEVLQKEQSALDKVNDEVFKDFCKELGIANIKEFEGGTNQEMRERNERNNELSRTKSRLEAAVQNANGALDRATASLQQKVAEKQKLEAETKELKAKEKQSNEAIKKTVEQKAEEVRKRDVIKDSIMELDQELKKVQDVLKTKQEERDTAKKQVDKVETTIEHLTAQRKSVIEQCALEEIRLPKKGRKSGAGGEGDEEGEDKEGDKENDDAMDVDEGSQVEMSQSESATQVRKDIKGACLDYSSLKRELKREMGDKERKKVLHDMEEERKSIVDTLSTMNPNMKAMEQLKEVIVRHDAAQEEIRESKQRLADVTKKYEDVKTQRCDLFNSCFEHVKGCIDSIYKELTSDPSKVEQSVGGSAYLTLNNQDEPYLDGIKYDTIPPGKRFMDMTHLSGGEKTVAALALLFAINSYFPAPFIVLDEVDAALDARNVAKVTRYIQSRRTEQQCVIISLKERFYEKADGLVGICRDTLAGHSKVFTLNLSQFEAVA